MDSKFNPYYAKVLCFLSKNGAIKIHVYIEAFSSSTVRDAHFSSSISF